MAVKSVFIYPFNLCFSSDAHLARLLNIHLIILSVNSHLAKCREKDFRCKVVTFSITALNSWGVSDFTRKRAGEGFENSGKEYWSCS